MARETIGKDYTSPDIKFNWNPFSIFLYETSEKTNTTSRFHGMYRAIINDLSDKIFKMIKDWSMEQLENSMETRKFICLCSICGPLLFLRRLTQLWLANVGYSLLKFALEAMEETVTSEVGVPALSLIAIRKSLKGVGQGI